MNLQNFKTCLDEIDNKDIEKLKSIISNRNRIMILGNGGSNAVSCHIAEDYTKALGKKAVCFGDSARMSCYANDYGWEQAYVKFIEHLAEDDSLIILISSSGNSKNIINAAEYCLGKYDMITMSGFSENNALKTNYADISLLHVWINSQYYGIVESIHHLFLHSVI
jgi:D-sedoheptulose 7-phosphate isomerase